MLNPLFCAVDRCCSKYFYIP